MTGPRLCEDEGHLLTAPQIPNNQIERLATNEIQQIFDIVGSNVWEVVLKNATGFSYHCFFIANV